MEEVRAYIESGVLELYVLGEVGHAEKLEVEAMALKHPAIKAELEEIERSMELFAAEHEIEPSPELRNRILNSMVTNLADDRVFRTKETVHEAPVVPMRQASDTNFYKYAFAACLALLLVSSIALYNVYSQLQDSKGQILALNAQKTQFAKTVNLQSDELDVYRGGSYKLIKLPGTAKTPKASMMVAWNPVKKHVVIDMANLNLPVNDATHQYQLWAIVDGKPVDLGVFDARPDSATVMKLMKSVDKPQAFAVTLEPKGGSVNPTMANMTVMAAI